MANHSRVAALPIRPMRFVVLGAADGTATQAAASTDKLFGVSQPGTRNTPYSTLDDGYAAQAGENINIFGLGEVCMLQIGTGGCQPGDRLTADADGKGIIASAGDNYGAIARMNGALDQFIEVEVVLGMTDSY